MTCSSCSLGLHHCHAALVEHDDGTATCIDGCGGPRAVHDVTLPCGVLGLGCCEPVLVEVLAGGREEPAWAA